MPLGRRANTLAANALLQIARSERGGRSQSTTRAAKGITSQDVPLTWSRDGRAIFVQAGKTVPVQIDRVDLYTGIRTPVRQFAPPDRAGTILVGANQWIDDGAACTYTTTRELSKLFVASGFQVPAIK